MKRTLLIVSVLAIAGFIATASAQIKTPVIKKEVVKEAEKVIKKEVEKAVNKKEEKAEPQQKEVKQEAAKTVEKADNAEKKVEASGKPFNSVCPVSGEEIDGKLTASYEGRTYALCCKRCLAKFTKDPAKYAKNISADGKKFIK
jgi:YHS domain-containing protein